MSLIIDRRLNPKNRSAVNRRRFIRRYKSQMKEAVERAIDTRSVSDVESGQSITVPVHDISEPTFRHGEGGRRERVFPGNKEFQTGDRIDRPPSGGGGGGSEASEDGEGLDEFSFTLSRDEFLDLFFEDMALPDLAKTQLERVTEWKSVRAGYTTDGVPAAINVVRSLEGALARRLALGAPYARALRELETSIADNPGAPNLAKLETHAEGLRNRLGAIPWIDTFDLRFNNRIQEPKPSTQAVMFCLMDVSGSMDEARKALAKRFFVLLYLFLTRTYEHIELVYIRHHTVAAEVNEEDFFHARETGGTVVSSALELAAKVMDERFASDVWNIYIAQASDGDNWDSDSGRCAKLLIDWLLPRTQYYAYVEIAPHHHQSLWHAYARVAEAAGNFAMRQVDEPADVYPVLRDLFTEERGS